MAQATRRAQPVPQRVSSQTELSEQLRSRDPHERVQAIANLALYLNDTLNPPSIDYRYFPVLRLQREQRERAVEGDGHSHGIDLRYFPVLRMKRRLDTVFGYVPALVERLDDKDAQVRAAAAHMLGLIGDSRAYDAIRRLSLDDPNELVRSIANTSLQLIPPPETRRR